MSYRHTVIGEMGSGQDWKSVKEKTLTRIAERGEEHRDGPVTIYGTADERIAEGDPERGHLATESIDELSRTSVGQYPYAYRVEGEQRALYYVRPTQVVTFGAP